MQPTENTRPDDVRDAMVRDAWRQLWLQPLLLAGGLVVYHGLRRAAGSAPSDIALVLSALAVGGATVLGILNLRWARGLSTTAPTSPEEQRQDLRKARSSFGVALVCLGVAVLGNAIAAAFVLPDALAAPGEARGELVTRIVVMGASGMAMYYFWRARRALPR